jgi:hypothetical protein
MPEHLMPHELELFKAQLERSGAILENSPSFDRQSNIKRGRQLVRFPCGRRDNLDFS